MAFEEGIVAKLDCHIVGRFFKVGPENVCFWNKDIQLDSYFLARDLEVLKSIYIVRVDVSDQQGPSSEHQL